MRFGNKLVLTVYIFVTKCENDLPNGRKVILKGMMGE